MLKIWYTNGYTHSYYRENNAICGSFVITMHFRSFQHLPIPIIKSIQPVIYICYIYIYTYKNMYIYMTYIYSKPFEPSMTAPQHQYVHIQSVWNFMSSLKLWNLKSNDIPGYKSSNIFLNKNRTGWWFQPIWKNICQIGNLPQIQLNIKTIFELPPPTSNK